MKTNTFQFIKNKTTARVLLVLVLGTCLIQGAILYSVIQHFHQRQTIKLPIDALINDISHTTQIAKVLSDKQLKKNASLLHIHGLRVRLSEKTLPQSLELQTLDLTTLRNYITLHHHTPFRISIAINQHQWLNFSSQPTEHIPFPWGFSLTLTTLSLALLLLYLWSANYLSIPFDAFYKASQRFSVDLQAPPMALQGSPEMQEAIHAFNHMQARIRQLVANRTEMLAAISHDLRTPITRLRLRVEYLNEHEQYQKAINDLNEMDTMIASILAFTRDHASAEALEYFDINALLCTLCDDFTDTGKKAIFTTPGHRITVQGRIMSIKRALINLIDNAIKYGKEASITLEEKQQEIIIKITDQGKGIPTHEHEKVFEPFYRVDPSRSPETSGTGLGMAVARDIIRTHGGEVALMNNHPNGLTVIITLPLNHLSSTDTQDDS